MNGAARASIVAAIVFGFAMPARADDALPSAGAVDATVTAVYVAALDRCRTVYTPRAIFTKLAEALTYPDPTDSIEIAAAKLPAPIETGDRATDIAALRAFIRNGSARVAATDREEATNDLALTVENAIAAATGSCTDVTNRSEALVRALGLDEPGTGLTLTQSDDANRTFAAAVAVGSPAARVGIARGDRISTFDRDDAGGIERVTFVHAGVRHAVLLRPEGVAYPTTVIRPIDAVTEYLALTGFGTHTERDVRDAVASAKAAGITSLILDLRYTSTGEFGAARAVASAFAPGTIATVDARGIESAATGTPAAGALRLVALVSQNMDAPAALVASAIQRSGAGKLLGSESFPDLTLDAYEPLPTGQLLAVKIATLHLPRGEHLLEPDAIVADPADPVDSLDIDIAHDPQVLAARKLISGPLR